MSATYHTAAIRDLICAVYYTDDELRVLCFDYFREVHDAVEGMSRQQKITQLIQYAERYDLVERLLEIIRQKNARRYEEFRPRLQTPEWLQSVARAGGTGIQRPTTIIAEQSQPLRPSPVQPVPQPPLEIRLNVDSIRRQVAALNACTDFFSKAEDVLKIVAHLQMTIEFQNSICANSPWESARRGQEGLTTACDDLGINVIALVDGLAAADIGPRPVTLEVAGKLRKAQGEAELIKEQLRDECEEITRLADAADDATPLQDGRGQIKEKLRALNRKVGEVSAATAAVRKGLYDDIVRCVKQLTTLIPTDKE
jgi:hypothetical protein